MKYFDIVCYLYVCIWLKSVSGRVTGKLFPVVDVGAKKKKVADWLPFLYRAATAANA